MKKFFKWLESDIGRPRKVVLLSTVSIYLILTILIFISPLFFGIIISEQQVSLFMIFTGLVASVYAFFTGTSSDKSSALADKAADIMMKKLEEMNIEPESASLHRVPVTTEKLDVENAKKVMRMIDAFDEDEDVSNVYHNLEMTPELEEALEEE